MRSSNPVLTRLGQAAQAERMGYVPPQGYAVPAGYQGSPTGTSGYQTVPGYPAAGYPAGPGYAGPGYGGPGQPPVGSPAASRPMTIDDVVTRTVLLVGLTVVAAAASWLTLRTGPVVGFALVGSMLAGFVLGLVIAFARITNPIVISIYAIAQGVLLGVVSREFEQVYPGIVVQAVVATLAVFAGMAVLYKTRVLRATPRFRRGVIGALIGVVVLAITNGLFAAFGHNLGLVYYSPTDKPGAIAILFSLACIVIGAMTFILDFDAVEQGLRYGLPERYAWYCAFGMLVGLIYLYWQILRMLGYLRR